MRLGLRDLMREPLVHFVLIGAALFGLDLVVNPVEPSPPSPQKPTVDGRPPIVIDGRLRASLSQAWERTHPGPPSADQLDELIDRWVDQEVLYREGVRRGFAENDPQIRDRVVDQMQYTLEQGTTLAEPTEAQLRAWFEAHGSTLQRPDRVDFTQVFVDGKDEAATARARALRVLLEDGAKPAGLGDTFAGGRRFRGRKLEDVAKRFGKTFAEGLDTEPLGAWTLRGSTFGQHLVRVDRIAAGGALSFEAARSQVLHRWREEQSATRLGEATRALRERWAVVQQP